MKMGDNDRTAMICLSCVVNIMTIDTMATQVVRASAARFRSEYSGFRTEPEVFEKITSL